MKSLTIILKLAGSLLIVFAVVWGIRLLIAPSNVVDIKDSTNAAQILTQAMQAKGDDRSTQLGASLYAAHCASCHGINLEGQLDWQVPNQDGTPKAPPHDDSGHTWHHDDATLFNYTKLGGKALLAESGITNFVSGMPGFADTLSDEQINQVLAFIKSRWSARSRKVQRERNLTAAGK